MTGNFLVNVHMVTYNHENYIAQAIEGVIKQETNFDYLLIIGDDGSTDNTREICMDYKKKFPAKIKLLFHQQNLGGDGKLNSMAVFAECNGKYIAMCEGDDYWTDPYKLQKQVDFLEANADYRICFHETIALRDSGVQNLMLNLSENASFQITDLVQRNFIPTVSTVFKVHEFLKPLDPRLAKLSTGDWALHLLNAQHGKIYYLKDCMAVYRIHENGIWSSMRRDVMVKKTINSMDDLNDFFDGKYHEDFEKGKKNLLEEYQRELARHTLVQPSYLQRIKLKIKSFLTVPR